MTITLLVRDGILQGQSGDYPLTEKGIDGAVKVGRALHHIAWDVVLTSDLPRAVNVSKTLGSNLIY